MATLNENIKRIEDAKLAIKTSIEAKGVAVGDGLIDTYAAKIDAISAGGSCKLQAVSKTITSNGLTSIKPEPGFDGISQADVTVDVPGPVLQPLEVTQNGDYLPEMGVDGYDSVMVNVPSDKKPEEVGNETVTSNGKVKFTPTAGSVYSEMNVDVQVPIPTLEERTTKEITRNGNYTVGPTINPETSKPYDGMKLCDVNVNIPLKKVEGRKSITINSNKVENINPSQGFDGLEGVDITVNVPTSSVSVNPSDVIEFAKIGYEEKDIKYLPLNPDETYEQYSTRLKTSIEVSVEKYNSWDPSKTSTFFYFNGVTLIYAPKLDTHNVTSASSMFLSQKELVFVPEMNTSKVNNMESMFNWCSSIKEVPLMDTKLVTNMHAMFENCKTLQTVPQFDTRNVTNMYSMFSICKQLVETPEFNISKVTDMTEMYDSCTSLVEVKFKGGHKGINCTNMFKDVNTTGVAIFANDGGDYSDIIAALPETWTYKTV